MAIFQRRKQILTESGLQLRFARFVIIFSILSSIITAVVVFYSTLFVVGEHLANVYPQARLFQITRSVYFVFAGCLLILWPLLLFVSIRYSHRVAGPLPKIYEAIKAMGEGNFDLRVVLRKNDELKVLADAVNETAEKLKNKIQK